MKPLLLFVCFTMTYKEKMFTIIIEDWREAPVLEDLKIYLKQDINFSIQKSLKQKRLTIL